MIGGEESVYEDRVEAGRILGQKLVEFKQYSPLVLGLARGGIVVAAEVAKLLGSPLAVLVVRKIGHPGQPELGVGAIAEGESIVWEESAEPQFSRLESELKGVVEKEKKELVRRIKLYRKGRKLPNLEGQTVILVDDGVATGVSALAAVASTRLLSPKTLVFATPVCSQEAAEALKVKVDSFVCPVIAPNLGAIGSFYRNFEQVTDEEVVRVLQEAKTERSGASNLP